MILFWFVITFFENSVIVLIGHSIVIKRVVFSLLHTADKTKNKVFTVECSYSTTLHSQHVKIIFNFEKVVRTISIVEE